MSPFRRLPSLIVLALLPLMASAAPAEQSSPVIIAHRGASGYLPEHTLQSAAYAHALGADYVEQDVVMSRDDVLVVLHDIHLDTTTDVAARFPKRARADGRYYAVDFTWAELRSLVVRERFDAATGQPVFPHRFPAHGGPFRLCTMEEQILQVQGLNASTGRAVGLYPEIKAPAWHAAEGKDPGRALLALLAKYGYTGASAHVFVQCFDPAELKRLRFELHSALPFVQLLGDNAWGESAADYTALLTPAGLAEIATYAQGIGPHLGQIVSGLDPATGAPQFTSLVTDAHAVGLVVHPYTFRADALPPGVPDFATLVTAFTQGAGVDGLFTDFTDRVRAVLKR